MHVVDKNVLRRAKTKVNIPTEPPEVDLAAKMFYISHDSVNANIRLHVFSYKCVCFCITLSFFYCRNHISRIDTN